MLSGRRSAPSLFELPDSKTVEVVAVELEDGRVVVRSAEELQREESPATATAPR